MLLKRIMEYGKMIKFSHSVFALPFALSAAVMANRISELTLNKLIWIIVAMVSARSAAMGFNRLVDKKYDALNPRTNGRHLPTGKIQERDIVIFVVLSSLIFIWSAFMLNWLCFYLSPVALATIFLYSYTKRFTSYSHYILGLGLGISPTGAWLAVTGAFALEPVILSAAVVFWVAGFDILYACHDIDFDKEHDLYSIPAILGVKKALWIARASHLIAFGLLAWLAVPAQFQFIYTAGMIIIAGVLMYEHALVNENNLSEIDRAFFNMNGIVSIVFFLVILGDLYLL
ncbi:MAG: UbiA family prenyltransferase [Calditrichaceae bacterium]|nr:UbiA family prenyltransferase [Calditrichaceae bacterium]MBN2707870.1 UbiA family prenyltransferase [Calditrichaceae bacterium]RQV94241.1 MAG: 4-hydroxybenzoate octaprenyltransferase [Calditrichota bacterium]